jgi:predicted ferric reductase
MNRAWLVIGSLLLLPVGLWASAGPLTTQFESFPVTLESLANIAALAGTAAFAINVVIGSRLRPAVRLFGGIDRMYAAHRMLGAYALGLVTAHACLVAASKGWDSSTAPLELYLPAAGWAIFVGTIALVGMVVALGLTFFARLRHETFVIVQKTLGLIFVISAVHVFGVSKTRSSLPLTICLAALASAAVAAFLYRSVLGRFLVRRYPYAVAHVNRLDESVVEIRLSPQHGRLEFLPGQFVFVSFAGDAVSDDAHPFSIASPPHGETLDIVVKALGDYTTALIHLRRGTAAKLEGPYGAFSYLNVDSTQQIWIAGGIGVTPFLSMARSIDPGTYEIDFYYCTERAEHAHFLDELFEISDRDLRLRVIPIRKASLGHISAKDIQGVTRNIEHQAILMCGPPEMIRNLRTQFSEIGVPRNRIYFEDFSFL